MKRIIIPTDFSEISINSILYGFKLAEKLNLKVCILHVLEIYKYVSGTSETEILANIFPSENITEMEQSAQTIMNKMLTGLINEKHLKASYETKIITGHLVNDAVNESLAEDVEMIILPIAQKNNTITRFTHNIILSITSEAIAPVLIIPSSFTFTAPQNIIYSTDFKRADIKAIQLLLKTLAPIEPTINIFHIIDKENDFKTELKRIGFIQIIHEEIKYENINFKIYTHKNVVEGIIEISDNNNSELIVMVKEHDNFLSSLFDIRKTAKITHSLEKPLLIFHESTLMYGN